MAYVPQLTAISKATIPAHPIFSGSLPSIPEASVVYGKAIYRKGSGKPSGKGSSKGSGKPSMKVKHDDESYDGAKEPPGEWSDKSDKYKGTSDKDTGSSGKDKGTNQDKDKGTDNDDTMRVCLEHAVVSIEAAQKSLAETKAWVQAVLADSYAAATH